MNGNKKTLQAKPLRAEVSSNPYFFNKKNCFGHLKKHLIAFEFLSIHRFAPFIKKCFNNKKDEWKNVIKNLDQC